MENRIKNIPDNETENQRSPLKGYNVVENIMELDHPSEEMLKEIDEKYNPEEMLPLYGLDATINLSPVGVNVSCQNGLSIEGKAFLHMHKFKESEVNELEEKIKSIIQGHIGDIATIVNEYTTKVMALDENEPEAAEEEKSKYEGNKKNGYNVFEAEDDLTENQEELMEKIKERSREMLSLETYTLAVEAPEDTAYYNDTMALMSSTQIYDMVFGRNSKIQARIADKCNIILGDLSNIINNIVMDELGKVTTEMTKGVGEDQ